MSLKIVKMKSGEDVISDIKETYNENEQLVAYMLHDPYVVTHYIDGEDYDIEEPVDDKLQENEEGNLVLDVDSLFNESGLPDKPFAIEKVRLQFYPWCPLSLDKSLFVQHDWIVTAYEPHPEIKEKYLNLLKEMSDGKV